ncbi:uncharacterized protein METZ01_LOCUS397763, partial [marine metagenome]
YKMEELFVMGHNSFGLLAAICIVIYIINHGE